MATTPTAPTAYTENNKTYIAKPDGTVTVQSGGSRNLRNNNMGNIEYGSFAKENGAIGSDGRFAIFPTAEAGRDASRNLLLSKNYRNAPAVPSMGYEQGSVGAAIYRWAPPNENDSQSYTATVQKITGLDVAHKKINDLSQDEVEKVLNAISFVEGTTKPVIYTTTMKEMSNGYITNINDFSVVAMDKTSQRINKQNSGGGYLNSYISSAYESKLNTQNIREYVNSDDETVFLPNVLDKYDNVTYRIRLFFTYESELKKFPMSTIIDTQLWNSIQKKLIYDSASTTEIRLDNLVIDSKMGVDGNTKKTLPINFKFDIIEPNGCAFIDTLKNNIYDLGYLDHKYTPWFMEISFIGYNNMDSDKNPLSANFVNDEGVVYSRVMSFVVTTLKCKIDHSGAKYNIVAQACPVVATSKDYFNFSKKIELSSDMKDLKSALKSIENELNSAAWENSLSEIVKSDIMPDNNIYSFDLSSLDENPPINFSILSNSGESAEKSAKYIIEPGDSLEKVLDDITCSLNTNNMLSVSMGNQIITADQWPCFYKYEPTITYKGQVSLTKQKGFQISYKIKKYYDTSLVLSQPDDHSTQTDEMFKLLEKMNSTIKKKYDYVFTSKNSQIIDCNLTFDMLWWVNSYDNVAIRNNDASGMVTNPVNTNMSKIVTLPYTSIAEPIQVATSNEPMFNKSVIEETMQMSLDMNNPINQSLVNGTYQDLSDPVELVNKLTTEQKHTGLNACVVPGTNVWSDSGMNKDAVHNSDDKARSSLDQMYQTGDMINLKLTIRGDPYWLCDIDTINKSVDSNFIFNVKRPLPRKTGDLEDLYDSTIDVWCIWGVYNIISIQHNFKNGIFTQVIDAKANPNFRFPI